MWGSPCPAWVKVLRLQVWVSGVLLEIQPSGARGGVTGRPKRGLLEKRRESRVREGQPWL